MLTSSRQNPIHAVTPASAAIGMCARIPAPMLTIMKRNKPCIRFETRVVPPQRTFATLRAGIPDAHRRSENSHRKVRDSISTQLGVRIASLQMFMLALEVLHRA